MRIDCWYMLPRRTSYERLTRNEIDAVWLLIPTSCKKSCIQDFLLDDPLLVINHDTVDFIKLVYCVRQNNH